MKMITTPRTALFAALLMGLGLTLSFATPSAAASEHEHFGHVGVNIGINIGHGHEHFYGNSYHSRVWVNGFYENVLQRVVVVPEHTERRWVEAVYQTTPVCRGTTSQVLISEGHFEVVCVPAVFEDRYVRVWREGCYRD